MSGQPDAPRLIGFSRTFDLAALFLLVLIFGIATWKMAAFFHDDALISLRYARNLALHGELAWNLGEMTEGYTNLLHVLLSAALIRFGLDPMLAAQVINWIAFAVLLPLAWALTDGFHLRMGARMAAMSSVVSVPVICWIFGGLEAVLVAVFTAAAYLCAKQILMGRDALWLSFLASAFFALGYLTRPDTLIANLGLGFAILAFAPVSPARRIAHFVAIGTVSALVLITHVIIRLQVYGELLPLTFYAKVGVNTAERLSSGITYLGMCLVVLPALWLLAIGLLNRSGVGDQNARRIFKACLTVAALVLVYVLWSGGDHMPNARFLVPLTPLLVMSTAAVLAQLAPNMRVGFAAALLIIGVVVSAIRPAEYVDPAAALGAIMGDHLNTTEPAPKLIAVATAGATPYFATHHTYIDTLGLNDPHIAKSDAVGAMSEAMAIPGHAKGDAAYVLSREPDIIIFGTATGLPSELPIFRMDYQLNELPEFEACYALEWHDRPREAHAGMWSPVIEKRPIKLFLYHRTCPKT
ncbi:hypothetical protein [Nereida sp. MMG025]|uniref:hypothetical protein n=1 Tax=Nereida sp. MMG025 TaxID=2909981 RepID=UPI001F18075A|nr:hypothetical protein [Nereida sp. MMG025]MCF6445178.1 hypothetical protein [Nereida sp. MMG025]